MKKQWLHILKRVLTVLLIAVGSYGFVVLSVAAMEKSGEKICEGVSVQIDHENGSSFLEQSDVLEIITAAQGDSVKGKSWDLLRIGKLESAVSRNPWVDHAEVYFRQDGQLRVEIVQKTPLFRVINTGGVSYYICADRSKMPLSPKFTAHVPVVSGWVDTEEPVRDSLVFAGLFDLESALVRDSFLWSLIDQVYVNSDGTYELLPLTGGHIVQLGNVLGLEEKLQRLKTFYREGMLHAGWDKYELIDLRFRGQVVCRKKQLDINNAL